MDAAHSEPHRQAVAARELRGWIERCARGDAGALRLFYDRLAPRALALASRIVGVAGDAEEVVQEAFLQVWRRARRAREYDPSRGEPDAWLVTIVRSRAVDRLRSRASAERTLQASANEPPVKASVSPLEDAERRAERERVSNALGGLPAEQRACLELAYYEGLSHSQIATRTGIPLGTVKTRLKLAVDKLGTLLGGPR
jgi:RNA polymerase sigma-70 factor (ECF subfamily)